MTSKKSKDLNIANDIESVKNGLYDREKEGNTVIADMIAMPHSRVETIKYLGLAQIT